MTVAVVDVTPRGECPTQSAILQCALSVVKFTEVPALQEDAPAQANRMSRGPSEILDGQADESMLDSTGAPIGTAQALLGHSSSEITRGTYIHSVPADARRAVEDVERLFATKGSLIGPKWTQVPTHPGIASSLIN